ncbi:glycosyltransferase family 4 protein [Aerococcus urinaeequi]|uniref:glycosyltransferase family 4 protein n=1 Tax=Aerococcus urinaeequi TaxID=51665 RepID=UPI003D6B6C72
MNILFLTLGRFEDLNEAGIYTDLLRKFRDEGHNVYVVSPREKKTGLETSYDKSDGINVLKVKIGNIKKARLIEKGISTFTLQNLYIKSIKKYLSEISFDLVLYTTPPITIEKVVKFVKNRDNAITYLLLKDIFPQNAVDLGMINKSGIMHSYFKMIEKKLYTISDYIGTMSPQNTKYLLSENTYVNADKVNEVPNSITPINVKISEQQKLDILNKYAIPDHKVLYIYGGNLGKPQSIDNLIRCILANEDKENSFILVIGNGTEYNKLHTFIKEKNIINSKLLKFLPKEDYELVVNCADVGLIFLDEHFTIPNFPSRLLSYLQAGIPIIAATDNSTDIGKIAVENKFGLWNLTSDVDSFINNMNTLNNEKLRKEMGKNGNVFLKENYTSEQSYKIIMNTIDRGQIDV